MNLYFFGADDSWENLQQKGFYRRNTCLLKAFAGSDRFERIFVFRRTIRSKLNEKIVEKTISQGKVLDVFFATVLPDFRFLKRINRWLVQRQILRQIGNPLKPEDLLFAYWPKGYLDWKVTGLSGKLIFDADHNLIEDPNLEQAQQAERRNLLLEIMEEARLMVSGARSMVQWFRDRGSERAYRVRNGVELSRFVDIQVRQRISDRTPTIGYLGTLSRWIDWELFYHLVERNPEYVFLFMGSPYKNEEYRKLAHYTNVILAGFIPPHEVVQKLQQIDVGLVLYRKHPAMDVDSMKIFEYLAANIPVVASRFHVHLDEDFPGLLYLGGTVEELEKGIKEAIKNRSGNQNRREEFLKESGWSKRAEEIIQLCDAVG